MSGRAPLRAGVNREKVWRILDERGGPDAIDWDDMARLEAAIVAREDQAHAKGRDALRELRAPGGISDAGMVEYLDSQGAFPGEDDMRLAIMIRLLKEYGGRLPRPRKG
jgi:hypothetical protein